MKIENTSERRYELYWRSQLVASIPRRQVDESTGAATNGSAEISQEALDDLLANHDWTKAVFASGDLVRVGAPAAEPDAVVSPVDFAAPSDVASAADGKGKPKK